MTNKKLSLELVEIYAVFLAVTETEKVNTRGIPFKLAWELADLKEAFKKPAQRLEEERNKILQDIGVPQGTAGKFEIEAKNVEILKTRMTELNETQVDVEFTPIHISRFPEEFQFAAGAFETLRKHVIEFPEPKEKEKEKEAKN